MRLQEVLMTGIVRLPRPKLDGAYYRRRAQECRAMARRVPDVSVRAQMLQIAETYDHIAEQTKPWESDHPNPPGAVAKE
jgi:hypothetical protein